MAEKKSDSLFRRLTRLFRSGPIVKRKIRALDTAIAVADKTKSSGTLLFQKSISPTYATITANAYNLSERLMRYQDFQEMEYQPEIASALDIYADEACLTIDSIVSTPYGDFSIEKLQQLQNNPPSWWITDNGISKFPVYSYDHKQKKMTIGWANNVRLTKKQAQIIKVTFDNGDSIRCTPDHKIMLRSGAYVEAQMLQPNTALMPFKIKSLGRQGHEYPYIYTMDRDKTKSGWRAQHLFNVEHLVREIKKGEVVHHKNFNRFDNRLENLEIMNALEHMQLHARINNVAKLGSANKKHSAWMFSNNPAKLPRPSDCELFGCRQMKLNEVATRFNVNYSVVKSWVRELGYENWTSFKNDIQSTIRKSMKVGVNDLSQKIVATTYSPGKSKSLVAMELGCTVNVLDNFLNRKLKESWSDFIKHSGGQPQSNGGRPKGKFSCNVSYQDICDVTIPGSYQTQKQLATKFNVSESVILTRINQQGFKTFTDWTNDYHNHKVVSVDPSGQEDVYDLTVDEHHNFACNGIIVHNCAQDDRGRILHIFSDNEKIKELLEDLFYGNLNVEFNLRSWVRNLPIRSNTVIPLLDGRNITIKQLAKEYAEGKQNWVYSTQEKSQSLVSGKISWCGLTREASELVRVWLDDETYVDCTSDHEWVLRDGSRKRADQLQPNQSLMPFYRTISSKFNNDKLSGYEKVYNPSSEKYEYTHRLIADVNEPELNVGCKQVVHHIDFNKRNNKPNNLQWVTCDQYQELHQNILQNEIKKKPESLCNFVKNHKVVKVEKLSETDDVYCMEVLGEDGQHDRHNFMVLSREESGEVASSGVCLSNCKYGDFLLYNDVHPEYGVINAFPIPVNEIEREENFDRDDPFAVRYRWVTLGNRTLENWEVSHFRLLGNDMFLPYGSSVIEPARRIWRQLILIEDAMLVYRVVRAPDRRVFYIDVANVPPESIEAYVEEQKQRLRNSSVIDNTTGRVDLRYNPLCISLKTFIKLQDGRTTTLGELIKEWESGKQDQWAYSIDPETGSYVPGKISWAGITRKNAELVRVTLDDGSYLDVTPDHRFMLRDGSYSEAKDLLCNQSLMPLYTKQINKKIGDQIIKYEKVYDPKAKQYVLTHKHNEIIEQIVNKQNNDIRDLRKSGDLCYLNHKVLSVELLSYTEDTGCINVEKYHNFAAGGSTTIWNDKLQINEIVNSFVYIHNSVDEDFIIPIRGADSGTRIDTLAGGQNTGTVEDVEYIQRKLFAALKIPKAYLGYEEALSCLEGDCKIPTFGKTGNSALSIEQLSKEYDLDPIAFQNRHHVYSWDHVKRQIVPSPIIKAWKTKEVTKLIELTFDDGTTLRTTPEHPVMLRNGSMYRNASDLKQGDAVMPVYGRLSTSKNDYLKGYHMYLEPDSGKWNYSHRSAGKFKYDKSLTRSNVIHHVDFNKLNNDPSNLLYFKSGSIHRTFHALLNRVNKSHVGSNNPRFNQSASYEHLCSVASMCSTRQELNKLSGYGDRVTCRLIKEKGSNWQQFVKQHMPNSVGSHRNVRYSTTYEDVAYAARKLSPNVSREKVAAALNVSTAVVDGRVREAGYSSWGDFKKSVVLSLNKGAILSSLSRYNSVDNAYKRDYKSVCNSHIFEQYIIDTWGSENNALIASKVLSNTNHVITNTKEIFLDSPIAVYDLEVEKHHNFAVHTKGFNSDKNLLSEHKLFENSVIVSNSKSTLAQQDIRFSRTIAVIQKTVIAELNKLAIIHLYANGFSEEDLANFTLRMSNPSTVAQQQKLELWRAMFEIAGSIPEGMGSKRFIYKRIWSLTDDEIADIDEDRLREKIIEAMIEGAGGEADASVGGGGAGGGDLFGDDSGDFGGDELGDDFGDGDDLDSDLGDSGDTDLGGDDPPEENAGDEPEEDQDPDLELLTSSDDFSDLDKFNLPKQKSDLPPVKVTNQLKRALYNRSRKRTHGPSKTHMPDFVKMTGNDSESMRDPYDNSFLKSLVKNSLGESFNESPVYTTISRDMKLTLKKMAQVLKIGDNQPGSMITEGEDIQDEIDNDELDFDLVNNPVDESVVINEDYNPEGEDGTQ